MKMFVVCLVLGLLLFGCTNYGTGSGSNAHLTPSSTSPGGTVTIHINNFAFNPSQVTVKNGTAVIWINDDSASHSVKFASFQSPLLPTGGSYTHTFTDVPGTYSYSCGIHPMMQGTLVVIQ